jgi:hypothetical protein
MKSMTPRGISGLERVKASNNEIYKQTNKQTVHCVVGTALLPNKVRLARRYPTEEEFENFVYIN